MLLKSVVPGEHVSPNAFLSSNKSNDSFYQSCTTIGILNFYFLRFIILHTKLETIVSNSNYNTNTQKQIITFNRAILLALQLPQSIPHIPPNQNSTFPIPTKCALDCSEMAKPSNNQSWRTNPFVMENLKMRLSQSIPLLCFSH